MGKYDDIIHLPHPVSGTHPPMPRAERAAQFSSFAALSGYEEAVAESARLTETRTELDRDALEELDKTIRALVADAAERPEAVIRYFIPDEKKAGGRYETVRGRVKKIDEYAALLVLAEGKKIPLGDVVSIEKVEKA
ncbi:MAG: hypothetical protein IKD61_05755 [Oscillospiraceae bacterium]|nr:hypothetical protein [Oscillospiraceae bacterium]